MNEFIYCTQLILLVSLLGLAADLLSHKFGLCVFLRDCHFY